MLTLIEKDISPDDRSHFYRKEAEHWIANSLQLISALVRQRARSGDVSDPQTNAYPVVPGSSMCSGFSLSAGGFCAVAERSRRIPVAVFL